MSSKLSTFICQNCGSETSQYFGKCLNCNSWNSIVEEIKSKRSKYQEIKNSNKRDYLLILLSGFFGGLFGGYLSNEIQIPDNIWYLSEFLKLVFAVFSMHGLQFIFKKTGFRK